MRSAAPRLELLEERIVLTAGQLDPTFGTGGKVITDFVGPVSAFASCAAIQSDGKVVVAGYSAGAGLTPHFEVARYTTDGHLDNTFGSGGQVQLDFGTAEFAHGAKPQRHSNSFTTVPGSSGCPWATQAMAALMDEASDGAPVTPTAGPALLRKALLTATAGVSGRPNAAVGGGRQQ